ncbi:vesicle transport protein SEC20-like [Stegodyphus dumicola]|uniref:vesicle transport protein SEC20-like n=1 Tax=Stegodyphus dumicola TaxID=202533 RepID=UPI0015B26270|nr:vesicle transport protein SEC20-like [Stegodyphus dumicola]
MFKNMFQQTLTNKNCKNNESTIRMIQQEIVKSDLHVKAYLQDIRECTGPIEVLNTINLQVSENMKAMKNAIQELEIIAREQDKDSDQQELLKEVGQYLKQYTSNQIALRKANLACQAIIDKQNKEELLERSAALPRKRVRADKESLAKQSSSITDNLVSIKNMMDMQVKQSEEALHTLVSSSAVVTDTSEEFKAMGSAINQSKTLLQKYGRREVTDRVLIILAVIFFISCILYVVQKRLF